MWIIVQFFGCWEEVFSNLWQPKELLNKAENMDWKDDKGAVVILFKISMYFPCNGNVCAKT